MAAGLCKREQLNDSDIGWKWTDKSWTLLLAPDDWLKRMQGGGSREISWHSANLKAAQDPLVKAVKVSGVYEQALGRHPADTDLVPFYFGETSDLWSRLKAYADTGSHISVVYSQVIRRGLFVFVRWRRLDSKKAAEEEEKRILTSYDFAANIKDNDTRRMNEVFAMLQPVRSPGSGFALVDRLVDAAVAFLKLKVDDTVADGVHAAVKDVKGTAGHVARAAGGYVRAEVRSVADEVSGAGKKVIKEKLGEARQAVMAKLGQSLRQLGFVNPGKAAQLAQKTGESLGQGAAQLVSPSGSSALRAVAGASAVAAGGALLPVAALGVAVASLGVGLYNSYQLHRALGKLDGLHEEMETLTSAVHRSSEVLEQLVVDCALGFDGLQVRLDDLQVMLERRLGQVERKLDDMEALQLRRDVIYLQGLVVDRWKELSHDVYCEEYRQSLIDHSRRVVSLAEAKLRGIPRGSPLRLGFVMLRARAKRAEVEGRLWDEHYWSVAQELKGAEEECDRLANQAIGTGLQCLEQIERLPQGSETSICLFKDRDMDMALDREAAAAHRAIDLRHQLAELREAPRMQAGMEALRAQADLVAEEAQALCSVSTLYQLATERRTVMEAYVFLRRGLLTDIEGQDTLDEDDIFRWEDGLDSVRALIPTGNAKTVPASAAAKAAASASTPASTVSAKSAAAAEAVGRQHSTNATTHSITHLSARFLRKRYYRVNNMHKLGVYAQLKGLHSQKLQLQPPDGGNWYWLTAAEMGARVGLPADISEYPLAQAEAEMESVALAAGALRADVAARLRRALYLPPLQGAELCGAAATPEEMCITQAENQAEEERRRLHNMREA